MKPKNQGQLSLEEQGTAFLAAHNRDANGYRIPKTEAKRDNRRKQLAHEDRLAAVRGRCEEGLPTDPPATTINTGVRTGNVRLGQEYGQHATVARALVAIGIQPTQN